jgi:hypothetical protein
VIPPYLHPDGTSILRAKPDHPATVDHLVAHGYSAWVAERNIDPELWHSMAHSEPRIETAITAALQLGSDWRHLTITGFEERYKDLLDLLGEAKEENDRLRGIIQDTIDYHRDDYYNSTTVDDGVCTRCLIGNLPLVTMKIPNEDI